MEIIVKLIGIVFFTAFVLSACQVRPPTPSPTPTTVPQSSASLTPSSKPGSPSPAGDVVGVIQPQPNQVIKSPLLIRGSAPGTWFFEAQLSARLVTPDGKTLASGPLQAQGEWMTEAAVPFEGSLTFMVPAQFETGTLVIEKDNPSGLQENAGSVSLPIRFR